MSLVKHGTLRRRIGLLIFPIIILPIWPAQLLAYEQKYSSSVIAPLPGPSSYRVMREVLNKDSQISSVEQFLSAISREPRLKGLLSNYALMYSSLSAQRDGVSTDFPRVIAFNNDLLMAITGDVTRSSYGKVEIIEYDRNKARFKFHRIDFSGKNGPAVIEAPSSCEACHAGRPIWGEYHSWPGAIGSDDNKIDLSDELQGHINPLVDERKVLSNFLDTRQQQGVFRFFNRDRFTLPAPDKRLDSDPNSALTQFIANLNFHRLYRVLSAHREYKRYVPVLIAAVKGCKEIADFLPASARAVHDSRILRSSPELAAPTSPDRSVYELIKREIETDTARRLKEKGDDLKRALKLDVDAKAAKAWTYFVTSDLQVSGKEKVSSAANLRYVLAGMGIELKEFSLDRHPGGDSYLFGTPIRSLYEVAENYLFLDLAKYYPRAKIEEAERHNSNGPLNNESCGELRKASLQAFESDNYRNRQSPPHE